MSGNSPVDRKQRRSVTFRKKCHFHRFQTKRTIYWIATYSHRQMPPPTCTVKRAEHMMSELNTRRKYFNFCNCVPTISHGTLTQIVGFNFAFKELRRLALKLFQFVGAHPIRIGIHFDGRLLALVISQGTGSIKGRVFVGPSNAATYMPPQTSDGTSLTEDRRTRHHVNLYAS